MSRTRLRARAFVLAVFLLISSVAPVVSVGAAAGPPAGMVGVADSNVNDIRASGIEATISESELEGAVYVDKHADTTHVSIATTKQAEIVGNGASPSDVAKQRVCSTPAAGKNPRFNCETEMSLIISDTENHEGREVAIRADLVRKAHGEIPKSLTIRNNQTGKEWTAWTDVRNGWVFVDVKHFSSNAVTWSGTYEYTAKPAINGTTETYNLSDLDSAENFQINLTGSENRVWENMSQRQGNGASISRSVHGTTAAAGPGANGKPVLRAIGVGPSHRWDGPTHSSNIGDIDGDSGIVVSAPDNEGTVYGLDPADGSQLWTQSPAHNYTAVASDGGDVYLTSEYYDSVVEARSRTDGSQVWEYNPSAGTFRDVAVSGSNSLVIAANGNNNVYAINQGDGTNAWTYSGHTDAAQSVGVASGSNMAVTGSNDQTIRGVALADGTEQWSVTAPSSNVVSVEGSAGDSAYAGTWGGTLYHVNASDGTVRWSTSVPDSVGSVEKIGDYLYVGAGSDLHIYTTDGTRISSHSLDVHALGSTGEHLVWSLADGTATSYARMSTDVSIAVDGTTQLSQSGALETGSTISTEVDLSTGSHTIDVSTANESEVRVELDYEEITETENPEVCVNPDNGGGCSSYTGTLADGSTTSISADTAWLQEGTNRIEVYATKTVSSAAPTPQVGVEYRHKAVHKQSVNLTSEMWTDRYEVSKTFASERAQASLNISNTNTVVEIRSLRYRINQSGSWSSVSSSDYQLNGNDLLVDADAVYGGPIPESTTMEFRANMSKVQTSNVSLSVVQATPVGQELETKIEIKSINENAHIAVDRAPNGSLIHYLHQETWDSPSDYVKLKADGSQRLYFPNAAAGETAYVSNLATSASVDGSSGDVELEVLRAGQEPRFDVRPGASEGDSVTFTHYATTSGTTYTLETTDGNLIDSAVAQSPVTLSLSSDDYATIEILSGSSSSGGDSGDGSGAGGGSGGVSVGQSLVLVLAVGLLTGVWFISQQFGSGRVSTQTFLLIAAAIVAIFGLEIINPASVVGQLIDGLVSILATMFAGFSGAWPLVILVGGALGFYYLRNRNSPDKVVNFKLSGSGGNGGNE